MDLCQKAEAAGVSFIAVHARTPAQRHEPVDNEVFRIVSDACSVPVIANGDVKSVADAQMLYEKCGIQGKPAFFLKKPRVLQGMLLFRSHERSGPAAKSCPICRL